MNRLLFVGLVLVAAAAAKHDHKHSKRSSKNLFEEEGLVQHREDKLKHNELNELPHGPHYASQAKTDKHADRIAHISPKKLKLLNKSKDEKKSGHVEVHDNKVKLGHKDENPMAKKNLLGHKNEKPVSKKNLGHKDEHHEVKPSKPVKPEAHKKDSHHITEDHHKEKEQKKKLLKKDKDHKKETHESKMKKSEKKKSEKKKE